MMYVLAAAVIAAASFLFAMLGLGGGMVYVPILHWMGFDLKTVAIPLGLLLNGLNTLLALSVYARKGLVDWRGGAAMGLAATVGAPLGAFVQPMVPKDYLLVFFAVAVVGAAARMLLTAFRSQAQMRELAASSTRLAVGIGGGGAIGFVGGLLGIGGGFLVGPILLALGYPAKQAAATTALVVTFSSISGFAGYAAQGHFPLLPTVLGIAAVLLGSQLGARFMTGKAKAAWITQTYAVVLVVIAAKLVWEAVGQF